MKLSVNLGENSYPIYIENGILSHAGDYISQVFSGRKIMIISDDRVFPLYGEKVKASLNDYGPAPRGAYEKFSVFTENL